MTQREADKRYEMKKRAALHADLAGVGDGSERQFQRLLVAALRESLGDEVFMTHFPAGRSSGGGKAGIIRGNQLKGMGLVAGVPDLLFIYRGEARWMELKSKTGGLSYVQKDCIETLSRCGSHVAVVRTLADAFRALDYWGFPCNARIAA